MEIMENVDEDGELVIDNVVLDHAEELGIPSRLTPDDEKNNAALDEDTDKEKEQAEVESTKYTPKEPAHELSKKRKVYSWTQEQNANFEKVFKVIIDKCRAEGKGAEKRDNGGCTEGENTPGRNTAGAFE